MNRNQLAALVTGLIIVLALVYSLQAQTSQVRNFYAAEIQSTDNPIISGMASGQAKREIRTITENYQMYIGATALITVLLVLGLKDTKNKQTSESEKLKETLEKLNILKQEGIITNDEYEQKRKDVISKYEI